MTATPTPLELCIKILEKILWINGGFASIILRPLHDEETRMELERHYQQQRCKIDFPGVIDTDLYWVDVTKPDMVGIERLETAVQVHECTKLLEQILFLNNGYADVVLTPLKHASVLDSLERIFQGKGFVVKAYKVDESKERGIEIRKPRGGKQAPISKTITAKAGGGSSAKL